MSNIAEGFERRRPKEFNRFLGFAKGSAGEVEAQLYIALDQGYITRKRFDEMQALAVSTKKLIGGFMSYLEKSQNPKKPTNNP